MTLQERKQNIEQALEQAKANMYGCQGSLNLINALIEEEDAKEKAANELNK